MLAERGLPTGSLDRWSAEWKLDGSPGLSKCPVVEGRSLPSTVLAMGSSQARPQAKRDTRPALPV
jgi:hypothetical protein